MDWLEPRSTSSHCGSANADDQRVPVLPSVAAAAVKDAFSNDDAVVGLLTARLVVPQVPPPPVPPPPPVLPVTFHCWAVESVQLSMSSRVPPVLPVRHSPEFGLTSSPLDWTVHCCALVPLHGYQSTLVPLVVPAETTSRQPPWTRTVLSV